MVGNQTINQTSTMGACTSDDGADRIYEFIREARENCDNKRCRGNSKPPMTCFDRYLTDPDATNVCFHCRSTRCEYDLWAYDHKNKVYDRYLIAILSAIDWTP